jgi:hypothetical protein
MAEPEINAFHTHLAVNERSSASTQNQALSALLFLYRHLIGFKNRNLPAQIERTSALHHRATYRREPFAKGAQPDWQRMKEKHDESNSQAYVFYCDPCSAVDSGDPLNEYVPGDDSPAQVIGFKEWKLYGCNRRIVDRRCVRRSLAVARDALKYLFLRGME